VLQNAKIQRGALRNTERAEKRKSSLAAGSETKKKRVVSGMRPTGRLHIGHYFGALQNWVRLQNDPDYDCFYFIADWHALTSDYADTSAVAQNTIEITTDYLAAGLDPAKSIIFQQSQIPEHAELYLLLSMVPPLGWLERVPTYKEALENVKDKDLHTYGFLGYPVLQTADIVIYSSPAVAGEEGLSLVVPVGEDQVSHVELSREIVRKFDYLFCSPIFTKHINPSNADDVEAFMRDVGWDGELDVDDVLKHPHVYGEWVKKVAAKMGFDNFSSKFRRYARFFRFELVLTEPEVMLTETPRIPGLDGRKMSKSYGNTIALSESDEEIRKKTKVMVTDPARKRRRDPGNPDVCPVYDWHKLFSPQETLDWSAHGCRTAGIGCIECKAAMADNLIKWIAPIRDRRLQYEKDPARVLKVLDEGSARAREVAKKTMERVREAVFGWKKKREEVASGEWRMAR
jgi:tryptophanyl-tRNA synthetase